MFSYNFITHKKEAGMKTIFLTIICIVIAPLVAEAQTSVSLAQGWPLVVKGADWDSLTSSTRVTVSHGWRVGKDWKVGVSLGVRIPMDKFHPVPRVGVLAGHRLSKSFALGAGLLYEFIPPYEGGKPHHFIGMGISPTLLMKSGVGFSVVTGPGVVLDDLGRPRLWTWIIQPQLSFSF